MKILIVSPLHRKLGPRMTASRVQIIYNLATGLIKLGHQVSILAPGTSKVSRATIFPVINKSLNELPIFENQFYAETGYLVMLARSIQKLAPKFDIIHNHSYPEFINLLIEDTLPIPLITTLHAPATAQLAEVLAQFPHSNLVAQSKTYRRLLKDAHIPWVVPNGINIDLFNYCEKHDDYLLWIGRLGKAKDSAGKFIDGKGVRDAIAVAQTTGRKLLLVGNVEDLEFYKQDVAPYLSKDIKWVSPISKEQAVTQKQIRNLMHRAKALLFPTKFEESFGLVVAEALSCGTPVIAYAKGSIPEIIQDNISGYLINFSDNDNRGNFTTTESGVKGLSSAVSHLFSIPSADYRQMQIAGRRHIEKYFTIDKMVASYVELYKSLIKDKV